jgi:hypothetical protein
VIARYRTALGLAALLVSGCLAAGACGRKTAVRAPALAAPQAIEGLEARNELDGIEIAWDRPTRYADGSHMLDLDGFRIERRRPCCGYIELARVPIEDRTRFQRARRFRYVDERVEPGELYSYRVIAVTVDEYESIPCEPVQIQRRLPLREEK